MPTVLKGKFGAWGEKKTRQFLSKVALESTAKSRKARYTARHKGGLSALKTIAPPDISPEATKLSSFVQSLTPGVGQAQEAIDFASLTSDIISKKKLSKSAAASLALSFAGIILPGKLTHGSRKDIIDWVRKKASEKLYRREAKSFTSGVTQTLKKTPQKVLDRIDELTIENLGDSWTRGKIQRTYSSEAPFEVYRDAKIMKKFPSKQKIMLSDTAMFWDKPDKAENVLAHEIGHSRQFRLLEQGHPSAFKLFKKEKDLSKKIKLFKDLQKEKPLEQRATIENFLSSKEYQLSFDEDFANKFANILEETPIETTEAATEKAFAIATSQAMKETLSRTTKTLNSQLREMYNKIIPKGKP